MSIDAKTSPIAVIDRRASREEKKRAHASNYACMLCLCFSLVAFLVGIDHLDAFLDVFPRSQSARSKEQCGQSLLLDNNYWLLAQTSQALDAIRRNQSTFDALPWGRLSRSIERIARACFIDEIEHVKEQAFVYRRAMNVGTLLAQKANDLSHSSGNENSQRRRMVR